MACSLIGTCCCPGKWQHILRHGIVTNWIMRSLQLVACLIIAGCLSFLLRHWGKFDGNLAAGADRRGYRTSDYLETSRWSSLSRQDHGAVAREESTRIRKWTEAGLRGVHVGGPVYTEKKKSHLAEQEGKKSTRRRPCATALLQGRRKSQEDRVICVPDIQLQVLDGEQTHSISLLAVFDGHFGHDVSELAATSLYPRLLYHVHSMLGDLECTACNYDLDTCPGRITGSWDGLEGKFIHAHPVNTNVSRNSSSEQCLSRNAAGMKDKFPMSSASSLTNSSKSIWQAAFITSSNAPVAKQLRNQEWNDEYLDSVRAWMETGKMGNSLLRTILKESLQQVVLEIDAVFSREAERKGSGAGSTACIVLQMDEHLLVANVGDSKAFLCSSAASCSQDVSLGECQGDIRACRRRQKRQKSDQTAFVNPKSNTVLCATELTSDHHPNRMDEHRRVLDSGGFIENSGGVPRVNGQLAVTRSIGDVGLKRFGIIAQPEFTGWRRIEENDSYIVVASDGVFQKMIVQDVCNVISAVSSGSPISSALGNAMRGQTGQPIPLFPTKDFQMASLDEETQAVSLAVSCEEGQSPEVAKNGSSYPRSLPSSSSAVIKQVEVNGQVAREESHPHIAKAVVEAAFVLGSMDNIAAVVLPIESSHQLSSGKLRALTSGTLDQIRDVQTIGNISDVSTTSSTEAEQENQEMVGKVSRQCYQLMKTLPRQFILPLYPVSATTGKGRRGKHGIVAPAATMQDDSFHLCQKASRVQDFRGRSRFKLDVYREPLVCTSRQPKLEQHNKVCVRPEGSSVYLSLIGSVPLDHLSLPASDKGPIVGGYSDSSVLPPYMVHHHRYMLQQKFAKGGFGEIWLGVKRHCLHDAGNLGCFNVLHQDSSNCNNTFDGMWGEYGATRHYDNEETFIFKRIQMEKGSKAYLSGFREKHFGEIFLNLSSTLLTTSRQKRSQEIVHSMSVSRPSRKGCRCCTSPLLKPCVCRELSSLEDNGNCGQSFKCIQGTLTDGLHEEFADDGLRHIARYIESIERPAQQELWLVFRNEGQSLSKLLYVTDEASSSTVGTSNLGGGFKVLRPSLWWKWLKTTEAGRKEMRDLMRQLLLAVHACHSRNITHRDIKPENMIVNGSSLANQVPTGELPSNLTLRIIDFGSALDPFTLEHLYHASGPSQDEQTAEYAPPEALYRKHWLHFHANKAQVYDMWSVGVVMLELVLGTPHVFQISARTQALLDQQLEGWNQIAKERAYKLRAFMELCILPQGPHGHYHHWHHDGVEHGRLVSLDCSEATFIQHIKQRDPLGLGMPDHAAVRLVRHLLEWFPEDRITAMEALQHEYFYHVESVS